MKTIAKILLIIWLGIALFWQGLTHAGIDFGKISEDTTEIQDASISPGNFTKANSGDSSIDIIAYINNTCFSILCLLYTSPSPRD